MMIANQYTNYANMSLMNLMSVTLDSNDARCYFLNYPEAAQSLTKMGIPLDSDAASFSYNYML